jgi:hypothetical protein
MSKKIGVIVCLGIAIILCGCHVPGRYGGLFGSSLPPLLEELEEEERQRDL